MSEERSPLVAVVMGSRSDWETMRHVTDTLSRFGVSYEARVLSAHRTPAELVRFVSDADSRGVRVFIAGAGGAAHLAGSVAAQTIRPVLGVPLESSPLKGLDALLATVQMPGGIPVGTLAVGKAGAVNAALLAVAVLALERPDLAERLRAFRAEQASKVLAERLEV